MAGVFGAPPERPCLPRLESATHWDKVTVSHFQQSLNLSSFEECVFLNVIRIGILYAKPSS